jgi:hypothetical protein
LASEEVEQKVDHIRDYFAQRGRLHNVAFRIRAANHRDCKDRSAQIGLAEPATQVSIVFP